MDYAEFEAKVAEEVEPEVAEWDLFESYVHASHWADKSIQDAADEVESQFEKHNG